MEAIKEELFCLRDENYKNFQSKLIPGLATENMIGVRTPKLRKYAKMLYSTACLIGGIEIENPGEFAELISELII